MCNSVVRGKDYLEDFYIKRLNEINSVLDIGCGRGIYAGCLKSLKTSVVWDGIEIWKPYVDKYKYNLNRLYNNVFIEDVIYFKYKKIYDLIIMGDVLEHMSFDNAKTVLTNAVNFSVYNSVSIPLGNSYHPAEHGNPYQEHITNNWTIDKLIKLFEECGGTPIKYREFDCAWLNNPIKLGVVIGYGKGNLVCRGQ